MPYIISGKAAFSINPFRVHDILALPGNCSEIRKPTHDFQALANQSRGDPPAPIFGENLEPFNDPFPGFCIIITQNRTNQIPIENSTYPQ